jgi:RNA polymerase sigma-70 factor (ECF subfamily)
MGLESDTVVQLLLQERVRVAAATATIVRDSHEADDIFQQVVLAALERRSEFREPGHVLAWALRAARHRALDMSRRKHMWCLPPDILDVFEARWTAPQGAGASDQVEALRQCMDKLGLPAREMLTMRYSDGMNGAAIAARLGRTADAVYQSLSRIHRALRECVEWRMTRSPYPPPGEVTS